MHWVALVILVVLVLAYVLIGGAVFMALEKDNEKNMTELAHATFLSFIGNVHEQGFEILSAKSFRYKPLHHFLKQIWIYSILR